MIRLRPLVPVAFARSWFDRAPDLILPDVIMPRLVSARAGEEARDEGCCSSPTII
jgi:hypothetical protein